MPAQVYALLLAFVSAVVVEPNPPTPLTRYPQRLFDNVEGLVWVAVEYGIVYEPFTKFLVVAPIIS